MEEVVVLGLGNPLLGDDGIGLKVVRALQEDGLPPGVTAVAAEGAFYQYWDLAARCRALIIVDALLGGGPPGAVYLAGYDEFQQEDEAIFRHEEGFFSALKLMAHFGVRPEIFVVGVEPKEIGYTLELSPELKAKIPAIAGLVREQCLKFLSEKFRYT